MKHQLTISADDQKDFDHTLSCHGLQLLKKIILNHIPVFIYS